MPRVAGGYDDDDSDQDEVVECPECGAEVFVIADRCPKCGHWFLQEDRRAMRERAESGEVGRQLRIIKWGAVVLLSLFVLGLIVLVIVAAMGESG